MKNNVKNNTNILKYLGEVRGIITLIQCHMSIIILPNINYKNHSMSKNLCEKGIEELRGKKKNYFLSWQQSKTEDSLAFKLDTDMILINTCQVFALSEVAYLVDNS